MQLVEQTTCPSSNFTFSPLAHRYWSGGTKTSFNQIIKFKAFKCYRHCVTLVTRSGNEEGHIIYSKEEVTQKDPMVMVAYGLGILLLIRELQTAHLSAKQP